jgi:SAM-dependent methyltransferase
MTGTREPQSEPPWYRRLFDGFYYDVWFKRGTSGDADAARTLSEVDFLLSVLKLPPESAVLDLTCGHCRHAIELAKRGYQVTGLDLSASHLALAHEAAAAAGVTVSWMERDMRDLPPDPLRGDVGPRMAGVFSYSQSVRRRPNTSSSNSTRRSIITTQKFLTALVAKTSHRDHEVGSRAVIAW